MNPEPQILGGRTIHWDVIFREIKRYNDSPWLPRYYDSGAQITYPMECVADLLSGIGAAIGMNYGIEKSGASDDDACRLLKAVGFNNVDKYYFDTGKLKEMVIDRGLPTYISGFDGDEGHAWVVDGTATVRQHWTITNKKTGEVKANYTDFFLYHCNFGWAGICDGYYQPDAVVCPRKNSKYSEVGDRIDPTKTGSDYEFTSKKRIIYYNRKN